MTLRTPVASSFVGLLEATGSSSIPAMTDETLHDLGLDRVFSGMRVDPTVAVAYRVGLDDVDAVRDRQAVFRDLEEDNVRLALGDLADATRRAVRHRRDASQTRQPALRYRLHLTAILDYVAALDSASDALRPVRAPALIALADHMRALRESDELGQLRDRSQALEARWLAIRFTLQLQGAQVVVAARGDEPDLSAEIDASLAPIVGASVPDRPRRPATGLLGHSLGSVEAWILESVAKREEGFFADLKTFADEHSDFIDPALERFAMELPFFTEFRDLMTAITASGVRFALPTISDRDRAIAVTDVVDLGLAMQLAATNERPVGNDIELQDRERIVMISGPNQGGKSTVARAFGQVLHLASIGCPVPAAGAHVPLTDGVLTLFPRPETLDTPEGGLGSEVDRIHHVLDRATGSSALVLNELFASTTSADARILLTEIVRRIRALGALALCVTFIDLATDRDGAVVSMVAEVDPADPSQRTFVVRRRAPDGRAYAHVLAERHGLTPDAIQRRVSGRSR